MDNPYRGVIAVVSDWGVGKTTFALECGAMPDEIVFINDDLKETGFSDDFKLYVNLMAETEGMKLQEFHKHCNQLVDRIPDTKVIIWDTWTRYAATFFQYVKAHENEFRGPKEWAGKPSIKAGEWYNEGWQYEGQYINKLKEKCDMLFLTFHLKQAYIDNKPIPGKFKPGHDKAISKYADMRIWLTPNPHSQVPIGLVMKNVSKRGITDQGIRVQQILPLRIENCNWETLETYYNNPIANRPPDVNESPNAFELSLIQETLTPENIRLYSIMLQQSETDQAEELMLKNEQEKAIKTFLATVNGLPSPAKVKEVRKAVNSGELQYEGDITPALIARLS